MDELDKYVTQILQDEYSDKIAEIGKSTVPLFYYDKKNKIQIAGSAVFVKFQTNYYLISAAHVLAEQLESTFTLTEYDGVYVNGNYLYSPLPLSGTRNDDKIDLMVVQLDTLGQEKLLSWYIPVTEDQLGVDHELGNTFRYFFYGYPKTRTRIKWNTNLIDISHQAYAGTPEINFDYERFGFSSKHHIAIKFDGNALSADIPHLHLIPDLTGISGSGLWYLDDNKKNLLLGIVIQRVNRTGQKALVSTRINIVVSYIFELLRRFKN